MAAGVLPAPGTPRGPCREPCKHKDCAATKQEAASPCKVCGVPIGYSVEFYAEHRGFGVRDLTHATCFERAVEAEQAVSKAAVEAGATAPEVGAARARGGPWGLGLGLDQACSCRNGV